MTAFESAVQDVGLLALPPNGTDWLDGSVIFSVDFVFASNVTVGFFAHTACTVVSLSGMSNAPPIRFLATSSY